MSVIYTNNASSRLAVDTPGASGTISVLPGEGAKFPNPGPGDYFVVTLEDRRTRQIEICNCTARSNDIMVLTRAQEGTVAQAFYAGATVSNRLTAAQIIDILGSSYTKAESDTRYINAAGDDMLGPLMLADDPVEQLEATTRRYVDNALSQRSPAALATAATLTYKATAGQLTFNLITPDLWGDTYTLSQANPENVDVYINGVRKLQTKTPVTGDFTVSAALNRITMAAPSTLNAVIQIDVHTPRSFLSPGQVDVFLLRDIDIAADGVTTGQVDGTRTTFYLAKASDGSPCAVIADEEIAFYIDGIQQIPNVDFTASGTTLTFSTPPAVDAGRWGLWFRASA